MIAAIILSPWMFTELATPINPRDYPLWHEHALTTGTYATREECEAHGREAAREFGKNKIHLEWWCEYSGD